MGGIRTNLPSKINCILCDGVVSMKGGDRSRFNGHMKHEHEAKDGINFLLAGCLMTREERKVVEQIMEKKFFRREENDEIEEIQDVKVVKSTNSLQEVFTIDETDPFSPDKDDKYAVLDANSTESTLPKASDDVITIQTPSSELLTRKDLLMNTSISITKKFGNEKQGGKRKNQEDVQKVRNVDSDELSKRFKADKDANKRNLSRTVAFLKERFSCEECSARFKSEYDLQKHKKIIHSKSIKVLIKKEPSEVHENITCTPEIPLLLNNCILSEGAGQELKQIKNNSAFNKVRTVGEASDHICDTCGTFFNSTLLLKNHVKINHPSEVKEDKNLSKASEDVKVFKCEVCSKPFSSKKSLHRHKKRLNHRYIITEASIQNTLPKPNDTNNTDTNTSDVSRHISEKSNSSFIKLFDCDICNRIYPTHSSLRRHQQKRHKTEVEVNLEGNSQDLVGIGSKPVEKNISTSEIETKPKSENKSKSGNPLHTKEIKTEVSTNLNNLKNNEKHSSVAAIDDFIEKMRKSNTILSDNTIETPIENYNNKSPASDPDSYTNDSNLPSGWMSKCVYRNRNGVRVKAGKVYLAPDKTPLRSHVGVVEHLKKSMKYSDVEIDKYSELLRLSSSRNKSGA